MSHRILVGYLALLLSTCSGWCTRLHHHDAGLGHHCEAAGEPGRGAEAPRPVNDDNCACAGAVVPSDSAPSSGFLNIAPLPFDHPLAVVAAWSALGAAGETLALAGEVVEPGGGAATAALRALRLRC